MVHQFHSKVAKHSMRMLNGVLQDVFQDVVAANETGARIGGELGSGENILPSPYNWRGSVQILSDRSAFEVYRNFGFLGLLPV
jgi:hypothetical protein